MKVICFDLDDTLFKEIEYLQSAYKNIAEFVSQIACGTDERVSEIYAFMLEEYQCGKNVFAAINDHFGLSVDIEDFLKIYRNHLPKIALQRSITDLLSFLSINGNMLGLITDGRSVQQRNKIRALQLSDFIENTNIIISEEFGTAKPSFANYQYFMDRYPDAERFVYIGDNIEKDFVAPNLLGWKTICLLDDGRNIHKQFFNLQKEYLPQIKISSLLEIPNII